MRDKGASRTTDNISRNGTIMSMMGANREDNSSINSLSHNNHLNADAQKNHHIISSIDSK